MFDALRKFLSDLTAGDKHPARFEDNDYRLAAAALLVHVAAIDGEVTPVERERLHAIIKQRFDLDEEATDELVAEATQAEQQAVDLYHFTSLINRSLDEDGRRRMVEMMWEIVYADGRVTEFEDNLARADRAAPECRRRAGARRAGRLRPPWRSRVTSP